MKSLMICRETFGSCSKALTSWIITSCTAPCRYEAPMAERARSNRVKPNSSVSQQRYVNSTVHPAMQGGVQSIKSNPQPDEQTIKFLLYIIKRASCFNFKCWLELHLHSSFDLYKKAYVDLRRHASGLLPCWDSRERSGKERCPPSESPPVPVGLGAASCGRCLRRATSRYRLEGADIHLHLCCRDRE